MKPSRHARNNMRLYGVSEREIIEAIQTADYIYEDCSDSALFFDNL